MKRYPPLTALPSSRRRNPIAGKQEIASAIVITLTLLALVTILAVGMFSVMMPERVSANANVEAACARSFAEMAADQALSLIREATTTGTSNTFWASQPGRITVFNGDGSVNTTASRDLHSGKPAGGIDTDAVDLNQPSFGGKYPVASPEAVASGAVPAMKVKWINVLQDPTQGAGVNNQIIGRYAFWVDDETAKLNINTADGTVQSGTSWYGAGNPSAVSLLALKSGSSEMSLATGTAIATYTGMRTNTGTSGRAFNDPSEILQVTGTGSYYTDNNFGITTYSRAPELNIFGEPKIYLVTTSTDSTPQNTMLGAYNTTAVLSGGTNSLPVPGGPLTQVYPLANQLPTYTYTPQGGASTTKQLPQYFQSQSISLLNTTDPDYALGMRIANYLKGKNSQNHAITWPDFGSGTQGFAGKYTDRQIDSIALQILNYLKNGIFTDNGKTYSDTFYLPKGFLSGKLVNAPGRGISITEVVMTIQANDGNPAPTVSIQISVEAYFPKEFQGRDMKVNNLYFGPNANNSFMSAGSNIRDYLNVYDIPALNSNSQVVTYTGSNGVSATGTVSNLPVGDSVLGGSWADNMLRILDQDGLSAGVDLMGNNRLIKDPDQAKAALYHPYTICTDTNSSYYNASKPPNEQVYMGAMETVIQSGTNVTSVPRGPVSAFYMLYPIADSTSPWSPGTYRALRNYNCDYAYPIKKGVTGLKIEGGLAIWLANGNGGWHTNVPLESIRGKFTGETVSNIRQDILKAVIPIPAGLTIPIPGTVTIHMQVADPLVNNFPADWITTVNPPASEITLSVNPRHQATSYQNGLNTISQAPNGDPSGFWLPNQDINVSPKSQRFPSSGYLQYIHTGLMPDKAYDPTVSGSNVVARGTPFRLLSFAPANDPGQQTAGGTSYPDWAMLDLFTVPAAYQPAYQQGATALPSIQLTWGGATSGRLNPNSALIPFSESNPGTALRTTPLEGVMKGLSTSSSYTSGAAQSSAVVDEKAIATAIDTYVASLGRPLKLPGEICNVPAVANLLYSGSALLNNGSSQAYSSRNDLIRQIIGNLSTRSNTYTVWTVGQTIKKRRTNTQYGVGESTDTVLAESRMKFVIERYLDLGKDGVPGNLANPGNDNTVGTPDDVVDTGSNANHPAMTYPLHYKYRVLSVSRN